MTDKETKALLITSKLWNQLVAMDKEDVINEDTINDLRFHIHAIQNIILARPQIRKINANEVD
jgi:hypothetical protein